MGLAFNFDATAVSLARAFYTLVGVLGPFHDLVACSISEHASEGPAIASTGVGGAVKDLLIGELNGLSAVLVVTTFNGRNGCENPA